MSAHIPPHRNFRLFDLVPRNGPGALGKVLNSLHALLRRISGIAHGDVERAHQLIQLLHRHVDSIVGKQEAIRERPRKPSCAISSRLKEVRNALKELPHHEQEALLHELEMRVGIVYDPAA